MGIVNKENALYMATGIDNSGLKQDAAEAERIIEGVGESSEKAGAKMKKSFASIESTLIATRETITVLNNTITSLNAKLDSNASSSSADAKKIAELEAALADLKIKYDNLNKSVPNAGDNLRKAGNDAKKSASDYDALTKSLNNAWRTLGIGFSVVGLKNFASEIINVRGEMQMLESSFEVLLKGKNVSGFLAQLKQFAVESPLSLRAVSQGAQILLGFNVPAEKVIYTLRQLGDVTMSDQEKFQRMIMTFSQIQSLGKLTADNLRELSYAGFNPLIEMSQKTGKTIGELRKDMESGAISAEMVADALKAATSEGGRFYGMTQKQAEGIKGLQAKLEGGLIDAYNKIGESQNGIITGGYKMMIGLVENYETVGTVIMDVVAVYGTYRAAIMLNIALEKAQAISRLASIKGVSAMSLVTDILTQKTQILNSTLVKNPYIAIAAVAIGAGIAFYQMANAADDAGAAKKRLDEAIKNVESSLLSEQNKLGQLNDKLQQSKKGSEQWKNAKDAIVKQYGQYFNGLDAEITRVGDLSTTYDKLSIAIRKSIAARNLKDFADNENKASSDKITSYLTQAYKNLQENYDRKTANELIAKMREYVFTGKAIDEESMKKIRYGNWADLNMQYARDAKLKSDSNVKDYKTIYGISDAESNKILYGIDSTPKEDKSKKLQNKQYWEDKKKEAQTKLDALSDIAAKGKEGLALKKEIAIYDEKMQAYDAKDKAGKAAASKQQRAMEEANKEKVAASERIKQIDENNAKIKAALESSETELSDATVNAMDEGYAKQQAQIKLNYQKRQDDIKKRTAELIKTAQENEKLAWINANPDYKKKGLTFTPTITGASQLTGDAKTELANMQAAATLEMTTAQKNSLKSLLDKYQDYAAKRTELEKKYNDDVKALEEERADAMSKHDSATVIATTEAIVEAKKQFDQSVGELDFEQLQKSIDWENVFGNLEEVSTRSLKALRDKLSKYLSESKNLSPDSIKAVSESLQKMDEQIKNRDPFEAISSGLFDYEEAARRVSLAQEQLNRLTREGLDGSSDYAQAESDLANAESDRTRALIQTSKALNQVAQYGQQAVGAANDIIDTLEMVGVNVDENTKKYIQGTGEIMDGLSSIDLSKPMTVITGSIKVMKGTVRQITSLLGWGSTNWTKQYEELKLSLGAYVDVLQRVIDKEKEALEGMSGSSAMATYQEAKAAIESQIDSYRRLAAAAGNAGGGMFSHSKGYKTNDALFGYWESLSKSAGITVDSIDDLYKLSGDQLSKIMSENAYAWSLIDGDIRGYLENIIDAQGELDDLSDSIQQALTGISFDSVKDGLDDLLQDTSTTMSDIADNFSDMMRDSVLKFVKDSYLTNALKDWYAKFANYSASDNKLTEAEIAELQSLYETIYGNAQSMYDQALATAGLSSSSYSQSSTYGSSTSMDQDTGDLIVGRSTAILESSVRVEGQNEQIITIMRMMNADTSALKAQGLDVAENVLMMRQDVSDISSNMNKLVVNTSYLKTMDERLEKIEKNTRDL